MSSWPLLQSAIAGTVAWQIAAHVVGHHQPFFAPIAAVVALNQSIGERGVNAVRLLVGVVVGIVAGEAAMAAVGEPPSLCRWPPSRPWPLPGPGPSPDRDRSGRCQRHPHRHRRRR
ncbi:MAG: FUSC family protein [Mycobacterium leprae]